MTADTVGLVTDTGADQGVLFDDCEEVVWDKFAGPGGWDTGLAMIGITDVDGVEWDEVACATARAAGHKRTQADVSADMLVQWPIHYTGSVDSPPCQGFSMAGQGLGRLDAEMLIRAVYLYSRGNTAFSPIFGVIAYDEDNDVWVDPREWARAHMHDRRSLFALEPLRYAIAAIAHGKPFRWIAWEQVAAVLPLWTACAEVLRGYGYDAEAVMVQAEAFGVPQTRKRAIVRATYGRWLPPLVPTHSKFNAQNPHKIEPGMPRWISMAQALQWGCDPKLVQRSNYSIGTAPGATAEERGRSIRELTLPSVTITGRPPQWAPGDTEYVNGNQERSARRTGEEPAPTVMFGARMNLVTWEHTDSEPLLQSVASCTACMCPVESHDADGFCAGACGGTEFNCFGRLRRLQLGDFRRANGAIRDADQPAPTIIGTIDNGNMQWRVNREAVVAEVVPRVHNQSGTAFDLGWPADRPSTVVTSRSKVTMPGGEREPAQRAGLDQEPQRRDPRDGGGGRRLAVLPR